MQKEFEQKEFNQTINLHCGCGGTGSGVIPSIGENGNWFIGDEDTGISAQGPKGDAGATGDPGPKGDAASSLDLKLLFSGQANTQGAEYELADSIESYKLFIIEYNTQDSGGWLSTFHGIIVSPQVNSKRQYGDMLYIENGTSTTMAVYLFIKFTAINKFSPTNLVCSSISDRIIDVSISKIYGIK